MNLEKSKKRIAKKVKMGFQGFPTLSIAYFGETSKLASKVVVKFILEEGVEAQEEKFSSTSDAREDDVIQSALVKMIERSGANTVYQIEGVAIV